MTNFLPISHSLAQSTPKSDTVSIRMPMTLRSRASKAREEGEEAEGLLDNVDDQVDSGETTEEGDFVMWQKKKTERSESHEGGKRGIEGDETNIAVLLFLYVLQVRGIFNYMFIWFEISIMPSAR